MEIKRIILIICGFLSLAIGLVGVAVPILPTTPLVLVSAACFGGSSTRLYNKLLNAKYFGEFVANYKNKTGISKNVKVKSILFLWVTLIISSFIFTKPMILIILLIVGISVTLHILLIRAKKKVDLS